MYTYQQKKSSRKGLTTIPAKTKKAFRCRQQTEYQDCPVFPDTYIRYAAAPQGEGPKPNRKAEAAALSAGTECIQAKWKRSAAFTGNVSVNETAGILLHFRHIANDQRIDSEQRKIAAGLSKKLATFDKPVPAIYMWEHHELYINGRLIPLSKQEYTLLEKWIRQEQTPDEEPLHEDAAVSDHTPAPGSAPSLVDAPGSGNTPTHGNAPSLVDAPGSHNTPTHGSAPSLVDAPGSHNTPAPVSAPSLVDAPGSDNTPAHGNAPTHGKTSSTYPSLDEDMNYLRQLNKFLDFFQGISPDAEAPFDEAGFFHMAEEKAMQLSREYLKNNNYNGACITDTSQDLRKPLPFIYSDVLRQQTGTARRVLEDELMRVWENIRYKNLFLNKEQTDKSKDTSNPTEQTRANLIAKSLMVLPKGLPLAGLFPDEDTVEIRHEDRAEKFDRLNKHAVKLITDYGLHYQDGGIIQQKVGCVCIMYFKEQRDGTAFYKPAFGISGYFAGKGTPGVKAGFQAMGIPPYLLEEENKPEALTEYLKLCNFLGIRKPSIQARLSYLQNAEEYKDIERWKPILCAEPAIVMAVQNLYGHAAELVLSFPFQGSLGKKPAPASGAAGSNPPDTAAPDSQASKEPIPKFTCARCAAAEKSFGAVIKTKSGIERRQVRMSVKHDFRKLFNPDYIRNPDIAPFESAGPAYMSQNTPAEEQLRAFLAESRRLGVFHGGKTDLPGTVPSPSHTPLMQQIRDDHGNPVNYIDVPGIGNNCFFYALQTAIGEDLGIDQIRETLRVALRDPSLFQDNTMVGNNELNALQRLSSNDFQRILHTPGFTVEVYGTTGLLQRTNYGNVGAGTPILINIGFNHFVVKR